MPAFPVRGPPCSHHNVLPAVKAFVTKGGTELRREGLAVRSPLQGLGYTFRAGGLGRSAFGVTQHHRSAEGHNLHRSVPRLLACNR